MLRIPRRAVAVTLLLVAVTATMAACVRLSPSATVAVSPLSPMSPSGAQTSPLALPTVTPPPTSTPDKGTVTGRLDAADPASRDGIVLFLGEIIDLKNGKHGAFLNRQRAPMGTLDPAIGDFIFTNVPPGEYSLILSEVESPSKVYMDPAGDVHIIKVQAGHTSDLGDVAIKTP